MASYTIISFGFLCLCLCLLHGNSVHGRGLPLIKNQSYSNGGLFREKFAAGGETSRNGSSSNDIHPFDVSNRIQHWGAIRTRRPTLEPRLLYGAKAELNVWGLPAVGANQASASAIWVMNGEKDEDPNFNVIMAGWNVHPELYGDSDTHFFVYWTADGHRKTGCYNLQCEGFVPFKSSKYVPGNNLKPVSIYDGEQYGIILKISRDSQTGDWWLHSGLKDDPVGHWPISLFTGLKKGATQVQWGGVVSFFANEKSPPMGNGHYPHEGGLKKSAFVRSPNLIAKSGELYIPFIKKNEDKTDCYQVSDPVEHDYFFGGPGGCTN